MKKYSMTLAGRELTLETGRLAKQANGSVLVTYGDTTVLVAATMSKAPREGIDFFPLLVDYEERFYSVGKIPGGFLRREARPSEKAILAARLIDRPLRPLFPQGFRNDVQVIATVMSVDQNNPTEIAAMVGASAALSISDIPFDGPIAGVVVGLVDNEYVINPTVEQAKQSCLHLIVAGTKDAIMMVEAGATEVSEAQIIEAIMAGHEAIKEIIVLIGQMQAEVGLAKLEVPLKVTPPDVLAAVTEYAKASLMIAVKTKDKLEREANIAGVSAEAKEHFKGVSPEQDKLVSSVLQDLVKDIVRDLILDEKLRPDGRDPREIRPVTCEVGVLPRTHGSGLFTRGQTQVLSVVTLGPMGDMQIIDDLGLDESKRYIHHYNFPSFSVGETRPQRGPSRRDIGHGALAERALLHMIPSEEEFPYTIRVVSEVLESNGSSSQGSVCGSTLALMEAGVPIKSPVSGVAMGLIKDGERYTILSDIQGMEDHLGDMDFKVAGTKNGITALQMDIKIGGLDKNILSEALAQAHEGRMHILNKMLEVISEPRAYLSPYAPRMFTLTIPVDKIKDVIGPGGKMINKIIAETGVKIDIEDDGRVFIAAVVAEQGERAKKIIQDLTRELAVGEIFTGRVTRVEKYGAFVELMPGKEALVHISQLSDTRVARTEDVVNVGDMIEIKVTEVDRMGRIGGSRKELLMDQNQPQQE
ncbi:MAG: polyribonucleotide nucleotidyltransferase [Bacillota bacterium]|nr:MAG: polyribonucleotide nucleotidyltransferase [Bacillota bacterium]MBS3950163.1 polyribonucleotide nucleotidyltransferase [Peptococcaceae bacterium]